jgi:hypothetical protein
MVASRVVWGSVAGLALLVPLVWALGHGADRGIPVLAGERAESAPAAPAAEVERLRAELAEQRERRQELALEVEWLRAQLDALARSREAAPAPTEGAGAAGPGEPESGAEEPEEEELWFDGDALAAAGVAPYEIDRLRETFDASEMQLIDLEHQARREGWYRSRRYWQSLRDVRLGLREEIGDDSFDLLLYATGRNNRVVIDDVLRESPGEQAGFRAGDVVMSYGGRRVFKAGELKRATTQGDLGDRVAVDVLRGDERIRLYTQRGPIGVKLRPARELPEAR